MSKYELNGGWIPSNALEIDFFIFDPILKTVEYSALDYIELGFSED